MCIRLLLTRQPSQSGFTLIELLIVLSIVTVLFSLIAPLNQQQVERGEANAEWLKFQQIVENTSRFAFFHATALELQLRGGEVLVLQISGDTLRHYTFEHVFFQEQQLRFNAHGFPEQDKVVARVGRRELSYRLQNPDTGRRVSLSAEVGLND